MRQLPDKDEADKAAPEEGETSEDRPPKRTPEAKGEDGAKDQDAEAQAPEAQAPEARDEADGRTELLGGATPGDGTEDDGPGPDRAVAPGRGGWRGRYPVAARALSWTVTGLSVALVFVALLLPTKLELLTVDHFARIPVELIFGAGLLLLLPALARRVVAVAAGLFLGALAILDMLDMGFNEFLGRGFNVVLDWILFDDAQSYLEDSVGHTAAMAAVVGIVVLALAVVALMALAVLRIGDVMARNSVVATRATLVAGTVWVVCASAGAQVAGLPVASRSTSALVQDRAERVEKTIKDEQEFKKVAAFDTYGDTPGDQLLTGLRGKDMIFTFIESYGRSAIEDPAIAPGVDPTLQKATKRLDKAGFAAKSGWLTSATYGGNSWLGHSTFLTGLWIDNQNRYRTVTAGNHLSLTHAFKRTGAWRTVGIMPGVQKSWPEGRFYGLDHVYDSRELGYKGPKFSWSTMPDQYALKAFEQLEHGKKHDKPLMALNILTSSHQPWAPIPKTIPWSKVGDGSVYKDIEKAGKRPEDVFTDSTKVKQEYGKSVQYSVNTLIDYVIKYGNKNTVLVFLGDHQPLARVSGNHASRDVPVSIVAHDPKVLKRISSWNWADGLMPRADTPVWKMNSFRDRFLKAYGSTPSATPQQAKRAVK
ncbi:sulfatase-like hydrolase/transferase [Streptomyces sp. NBRC 110028]|uniref:sulfatase-like hydrolase/transferase n=1 Tax=Streptomyces sp. NBRC 110028 TaxID=1621260 RepID=UPI000AD3079A|nr:sulfatase-like hydrolase/transferase [Streptomyces sp. NBRC 110028]